MKRLISRLNSIALIGTCAIAATVAIAPSAHAFLVPETDPATWTYAQDSFTDGTYGNNVKTKSPYQMFGMGYIADENTVTFAFNANMGIGGNSDGIAADKNIGWGDLFLNLSPSQGIQDVAGSSNLIGIRFAGTNESGVPTTTGVYSNATLKNITATNNGWSSAVDHYNGYSKRVTNNGGSVELIDGMNNSDALAYLGGNSNYGQSVMASGKHLGDVTLLSAGDLTEMGLNFGSIGATGSQTFGFSFARSLLPGGELNWIAHIMAECANDSMGMDGTFQAYNPPGGGENPNEGVPEPFSMVAAGLALGAGKLYKSRKK